MRIFFLFLQYGCLIFALFLAYQIFLHAGQSNYPTMELVADVGTILICIDLFVFLSSKKMQASQSLEDYAQQLQQPTSKWVKFTRKIGHLGIMLILCSWIVPMLNQ